MERYIGICPICGAIHRVTIPNGHEEWLFSRCTDKCGHLLFSHDLGPLQAMTKDNWRETAIYLGGQASCVSVESPLPVPLVNGMNADLRLGCKYFHVGEMSIRDLAKLLRYQGKDPGPGSLVSLLSGILLEEYRTVDTKRLRDLLGSYDFELLCKKYPGQF